MKFKRKPAKISAPMFSQRQGKWSAEEHEKMFIYVRDHRKELIDHFEANLSGGPKKNKSQFFKRMASFIETKNEKQCKSRYQKQEQVLLKALKLPEHLMSSIEKRCKPISKPCARKKQSSAQPTEDVNSVEKNNDDRSEVSIHTYQELRTTLSVNFLPRIQNDIIKHQMEKFLNNLPQEAENYEELPSLNLNSLSMILPQFNLSVANIKEKESSFLDDIV